MSSGTEGSTMANHVEERSYAAALDTAQRSLGMRLGGFLQSCAGEPANGADFERLATVHTFGDAWPRTAVLDTRTRALVSVTIAATLGTLEPLRGQLRIAPAPPPWMIIVPAGRIVEDVAARTAGSCEPCRPSSPAPR
jgi:alkylhydroperoxidase/carboxymuconolactone decarboxylase family protein YurZ